MTLQKTISSEVKPLKSGDVFRFRLYYHYYLTQTALNSNIECVNREIKRRKDNSSPLSFHAIRTQDEFLKATINCSSGNNYPLWLHWLKTWSPEKARNKR